MQENRHSELHLIRTKLAPPKVGSSPVSRDGLLRQLDQRRDRKLSLVIGPAGCGKTMLLTQWRRQLLLQGAAVAWYNAGADDDAAHVAAYLLESLRLAGCDIGMESLNLYVRSGGKAWKPLLASLINGLQEYEREIYVVIDDLHYISAYGALQFIDRWMALAPSNIHLVLGSRTLPPLDLTRLRAQDQVTELRFGELRFDIAETQRFIETQGLAQLSASQVRGLHDITDGWAAGLQLLTFSLRKSKTPEAFFRQSEHLSLSKETALNDFLQRIALEHLSDDELSFLTRISACRRFNRELCEVLTGDPRAAEHLRKFESENLFLIPIDTNDSEPWYRFHRLFSSFLNARLQLAPQQQIHHLHQQAGRWFGRRNLHVEAMRHALLAGDTEFVIELIDRAARSMINGANFLQLLQWCDAVPYERLKAWPNICLCAAWAQLSCSRIADFDRNIADIESNATTAQIRIEVRLLKAYRALREDDTRTSLSIVEPMQQTPPQNPFHALLTYTIASLSLVYANQFERAREVARLRHRYVTAERAGQWLPLIDVVQGFSHLVQGEIGQALASLQAFMEYSLTAGSQGTDAIGLFGGYYLDALYQSGQIARARDFLEQNGDRIEVVGAADSLLMAHRVRARIEWLEGHADAAQNTLLRLEEIGYRKGLDRLIAWSLYEQLRLGLRSSHGVALQELLRRLRQLDERHRDPNDGVRSEIPMAARMAVAEFNFARDSDAAALDAIAAAELSAAGGQRQLLVSHLGFLRAIVLLRKGEREEAISLACSLLQRSLKAGRHRVLPDIGDASSALVRALLESEKLSTAERDHLLSIGIKADDSPPAAAPLRPTAAGKGSALSTREQEVLELLARALSIKSIARALNLSPGTVKWHLKNIYGKLAAVSREDVLAKARALGIIP